MSSAPLRVMVVDDDVDTCRNLQDILGDLGFDVSIVHNGPAALKLVDSQTFDIALLDLKMPGMDGLELFRELKKRQPTLVSILVTGYASPETESRAREVGTWKILSKPVDLHKLIGLVREAGDQPLLLVVDDDADLCASLTDVFHTQGFRVGIAHSPTEAMKRLTQNQFQVVLVDLKLRAESGMDVLQAARGLAHPPRTLLMTGHRREFETTIAEALSKGTDAVCYKPFDVQGLLKTIRSLLPPEHLT